MYFKNLDLKNGIIVYDDFDINENMPASHQDLDEDLMQISFLDKKYLIDLGWYSTACRKGNFQIKVIKDLNWQQPLFLKKTESLDDIESKLQECINFIADLVQSENP